MLLEAPKDDWPSICSPKFLEIFTKLVLCPWTPPHFIPIAKQPPRTNMLGVVGIAISTMLQHQVSFREEWVHQLPEGTAVVLRNGGKTHRKTWYLRVETMHNFPKINPVLPSVGPSLGR